jgi:hypothetical protein
MGEEVNRSRVSTSVRGEGMVGPARRSVTIGLCVCLLVTMLTLVVASCGKAEAGIVGIVIERRAGMVSGMPTPSALPDGFGMSTEMPAKVPLTLLVEPVGGDKAGQVVARVQTNDGLFKVTVPPGRYVVVIKGANRESDQSSQPLTVRAGRYSRLVFGMMTH